MAHIAAALSAYRRATVTLLVTLTILAVGDLAEVIPAFAPFVDSAIFPYVHETHDLLALAAALYAASTVDPDVGIVGLGWFLVLHVVYFALQSPKEYPEMLRMATMLAVTWFGIHLIIQRRRLERELAIEASHDPLTGLYNRRRFHVELEGHLAEHGERGRRGALIYLDLDGFKHVNDRLGHTTGDAVLVEAARRLRSALRDGDLLARMGGDEFAAILPRATREEAIEVGERILELLRRTPLLMNGHVVTMTGSIGVATYPEDGTSAEKLLIRADLAMYEAKAAGRDAVRA